MTTYQTARMLGVFSHDGTLRSLHQSADDAAYLTRQTGGYAEARDVVAFSVDDDAAPPLDAVCIPDAALAAIARTLRGEVVAEHRGDLAGRSTASDNEHARELADRLGAIAKIGPARLKLCAELCAKIDSMDARNEGSVDAGFVAIRDVLKKLMVEEYPA